MTTETATPESPDTNPETSPQKSPATSADKPAQKSPGSRLWDEAKELPRTLIGAFIVYVVFTTAAFANYSIPSESMTPTLEVGDRVVVSKIAYGYSRYSLPFDLGALLPHEEHRLFEHLPQRGDVVVFMHPQEPGRVMIKRLIGLPGDVIEVRDSHLIINGQPVALSDGQPLERLAYQRGVESAIRYEETLPGGVRHPIDQFPISNEFDNWGPFTVPAGEVFFMGDNRDNSLDSRYPGMGPVPIENLIGKAETIYFTGGDCGQGGLSCPRPRWLKPLHD